MRAGAFWQREYYDRLIREDGELDRAVHYVLSNPEWAGLVAWKWVWCAGVDARTTDGMRRLVSRKQLSCSAAHSRVQKETSQ